MKKKIREIVAFIMVSTALLLMLGGSVFPHHHDEHGVCFDFFDHNKSDCQSNEPVSHTDNEAQCTLSINYYPVQKQDNTVCNLCDQDGEHKHGYEFEWVYPDVVKYIDIHSLEYVVKSKFSPYDELVREIFVVSSVGLRAPPFFVA